MKQRPVDTFGDPLRVISRLKNNRLMEVREQMEMSPRQFSGFLGISYQTCLELESLKRFPSERMARKISERTGFGVDYLFPGYLIKISTTVAVTHIPEAVLLPLLEAKSLLTDGGIGAAESRLQNADLRKLFSTEFLRLTEREEEVIRLHYYDDFSETQIAGRLGCSQTRVIQILHRALMKLRRSDVIQKEC